MGLFGFGKKAPVADRYSGKPFLKLVDSFVLKCMGELDSSQESLLDQLTSKFQQTFNCQGTWEEIVIQQLKFPPDIRSSIKALWVKNQAIAEQNGTKLSPMQFVEMFVDNNIFAS